MASCWCRHNVSVVHVLDPTVEDSDALLTVIMYVDSISKSKSLSLRIEGVAFCPTETAGVIPTKNKPLLITSQSEESN